MGIDASIALGYQPIKMEPQSNALMRMMQMEGAQRQNELGGLQLQQTRDDIGRKNALTEYLRGNPNLDDAQAQSKGYSIDPAGFDAIQKSRLGLQKMRDDSAESVAKTANYGAQTATSDQKRKHDAVTQNLQLLAGVNDPQAAAQWYANGVKTGLIDMQAAQQSIQGLPQDPAQFAQWKQRQMMAGVALKDQLEMVQPKYSNAGGSLVNTNPMAQGAAPIPVTQTADSIATNATSRANNAATVAGSRENNRDTLKQGERLQQGAVTYQTDGEGNTVALPTRVAPGTVIRAQPVVSGPGMLPMQGKDGGLNEGQSKALMFGSKMALSGSIIEKLEAGGTFNRGSIKATAQTAGRIAGLGTDGMGGTLADAAGTATNFTQSDKQRQYEGAKYSWIAGQLRKESGAAIAPSEYRDADNQYFPQPGDDAGTIANKKALRETAEQTMMAEVPRNKRPKAGSAAPVPPGTTLKFDAQGNLVR